MLRAALPCALAALIGGCLASATIDGLEFACDSGAGCEVGFRCWRGECTQDAGWNLGTTCAGNEDCASGNCSSGVCCSRRCNGACERCDLGGGGRCDPLPAGSAGSPICAPYVCDGASRTCPGACSRDPDCGAGTFCDAGACALLQPLGDPCARGGTCDSGLCVDGRCCNSTCGAPCDACNVAGRLGSCSPSPLGRLGSPSCGDYACNGTTTACPTTCAVDAGCAPGFSCSAYLLCQPKAEALYEPFNGTVLDGGTWGRYFDPGTAVAVNNRLELGLLPWAGGYCGAYTARTYDGTNSRLSAQLVLPGDQSQATYETYFLYLSTDNLNRFGFDVYGGALHTMEQIAGTYTEATAPVPYNPSLHRFLRLRVDGGIAIWETSADAGSFTVIGVTTTKPWMQTIYVELGAGTWSPEDAGSFAAWDNVRK